MNLHDRLGLRVVFGGDGGGSSDGGNFGQDGSGYYGDGYNGQVAGGYTDNTSAGGYSGDAASGATESYTGFMKDIVTGIVSGTITELGKSAYDVLSNPPADPPAYNPTPVDPLGNPAPGEFGPGASDTGGSFVR